MPSISSLIESYSQGAELLREAVRPVTTDDMDSRPIEGKWSIREVVCHLADGEIVYADRIKRVVAEENPTFFDADPNLLLPALHCQQRPLDKELEVIEVVRAHMLPILKSLGESDFQRVGQHSTDGSMTLHTLLHRITDHIPHHIAFIEEKKRLLSR